MDRIKSKSGRFFILVGQTVWLLWFIEMLTLDVSTSFFELDTFKELQK